MMVLVGGIEHRDPLEQRGGKGGDITGDATVVSILILVVVWVVLVLILPVLATLAMFWAVGSSSRI